MASMIEQATKGIVLSMGENDGGLGIASDTLRLKIINTIDLQNYYSSNGSIIYNVDMSAYFKEYVNITFDKVIPASTTLKIQTATSVNGSTFTSFVDLGENGLIASPSGRYLKIKISMSGTPVLTDVIRNNFNSSEANLFETGMYYIMDGKLYLRTNYSKKMRKNTSYTGDGFLYVGNLDKPVFKKIENVNVITG